MITTPDVPFAMLQIPVGAVTPRCVSCGEEVFDVLAHVPLSVPERGAGGRVPLGALSAIPLPRRGGHSAWNREAGGGVLDPVSYRVGFEDAIDTVLEILRARVNIEKGAVVEIEELGKKVRSEKAGRLLEGIQGV
jgi:hypothetical protein